MNALCAFSFIPSCPRPAHGRQVFFAPAQGSSGKRLSSGMAEDTISNFTAEPGKLAELLGIWNGQHQRMYQNKRAAMKEHRGNCANNCAGKVDPQWPAWSAGDLKESYLSELAKVYVESLLSHKHTMVWIA